MASSTATLLVSLVCLLQAHAVLSEWSSGAMGTFYGGSDASGTWGGHCGFAQAKLPSGGNVPLTETGYGIFVSAASRPLWKDGAGCGACYEVQCINHAMCTGKSVIVTITDECPGDCWADHGKEHFDLSEPAFLTIAERDAGAVPLEFRRVPCQSRVGGLSGGLKVAIRGSDYYLGLMVWNVGGSGAVSKLEVLDTDGKWTELVRDWGAWFRFNGYIKASQGLEVRVTLDSGDSITTNNCEIRPADSGTWYTCSENFGGSPQLLSGGASAQQQPQQAQGQRRRLPAVVHRKKKGGHHPKGRGHRGKRGMWRGKNKHH
eukprot:TRINITY_DN2645_c0_g1_i1.p1 TRINITY_DN2645_c0_g1~~TRINITY_DN2645_c0_g1_i1.p1  ORF type:complete len:317 (-),score=29.57 TRINITY_DN2645_c0_g1_i1:124-1074(-)